MKKWSITIILYLSLVSFSMEAISRVENTALSIELPSDSAKLEVAYCRALHLAVKNNHYFAVAEMLAKTRADCRDEAGNTAVHHFARYAKGLNSHRILILLIHRGFATLNLKNHKGETPQIVAVKKHNNAALMALIGCSSRMNPLIEPEHIPQ
jgi:hypothetical protein